MGKLLMIYGARRKRFLPRLVCQHSRNLQEATPQLLQPLLGRRKATRPVEDGDGHTNPQTRRTWLPAHLTPAGPLQCHGTASPGPTTVEDAAARYGSWLHGGQIDHGCHLTPGDNDFYQEKAFQEKPPSVYCVPGSRQGV